jgi:hypothetical protein
MAKQGKRSEGGLMTALARPLAAIGRLMGGRAREDEEKIVLPADVVRDSLVDESFTLALEGLLAEAEDGGGGGGGGGSGNDDGQARLHLISLVEFREAVGDKWAKVSEKVMLIAEGVINLHLGAGNVFGRKGTDLFVLVFRNTPAAEARRRAVRIAQDLGTRLVGSQFTGSDRPLALAAEISLGDALDADGELNLDALNAAVAETRAVIPEPAHPPIATAPDDGARRAADPRWTAMEGNGRVQVDPDWRINQVERGRAGAADPGIEVTPPMPGDAALSLVWRPTWMAEGEVIGAYRAQLLRVDQPGQPAYEGARAYPTQGGESVPVLDRFVAGATVRGVRAMAADGSNARVVVPLHWGSLGTTARLSVLAPLADIPEAARNRSLIIDLFGLPADLPSSALAEAIASIRPLCRDVMARVPLHGAPLARAAKAGAAMVSVDLAELPDADKTDDDHLLATLFRLRRDAEAAGLAACVWGVRRRKVVVGAVLGGFAMMNGPGLMKDLPRPAKVLPAPRSRFTAPPR